MAYRFSAAGLVLGLTGMGQCMGAWGGGVVVMMWGDFKAQLARQPQPQSRHTKPISHEMALHYTAATTPPFLDKVLTEEFSPQNFCCLILALISYCSFLL